MKTIGMLLCCALIIMSCSRENTTNSVPQHSQKRADIVGVWAWGQPDDAVYTRYGFGADGAFVKRFGREGGKIESQTGSYSMDGRDRYRLTWTYEGKAVTVTAVISGNTLRFEEDRDKPGDPSKWTYRKIS